MLVYPDPPFVTVIAVTTPLTIFTMGGEVYPAPPLVTVIAVTTPLPLIVAVAVATVVGLPPPVKTTIGAEV
jgi:hypothetical protein